MEQEQIGFFGVLLNSYLIVILYQILKKQELARRRREDLQSLLVHATEFIH